MLPHLIAEVTGSFAVLFWISLGLLTAVGLLALLSPRRFAALSTRGNRWIDTNKLLESLDKPIDLDKHVLPFSRWLGAAVLTAVVLLAALYKWS